MIIGARSISNAKTYHFIDVSMVFPIDTIQYTIHQTINRFQIHKITNCYSRHVTNIALKLKSLFNTDSKHAIFKYSQFFTHSILYGIVIMNSINELTLNSIKLLYTVELVIVALKMGVQCVIFAIQYADSLQIFRQTQ